jgi:glutaredoxin-related protein
MKCGVVYKFKPHNKLNGTLFYCFEYFKFLRKYQDVKFYIVDISDSDLNLVRDILVKKYNATFDNVVPVKLIQLYSLKLDRTLILDVDTFYNVKEFLTNEVHCFSNDTHPMFRYKNDRTVTYYGSYDYQRYDKFCYLKLNFEIFPNIESTGYGVFVSALDQKYIRLNINRWEQEFAPRPIILKKSHSGHGNLFDMIDAVHYVHTQQDTNNRIIPEAFYYGKTVTIEEPLYTGVDSIKLRYNDILSNGLVNYTVTDNDVMVQACLR